MSTSSKLCVICDGKRLAEEIERRRRWRTTSKTRAAAKASAYYDLAHKYVAAAVACGDLPDLSRTRVSCVDCGQAAHSYDHRDYTHPLDVDPVCRKCNVRRGPGLHAGSMKTC